MIPLSRKARRNFVLKSQKFSDQLPYVKQHRFLLHKLFLSKNFKARSKFSPRFARKRYLKKFSPRFARKRNLIILEGGDSRSVGNLKCKHLGSFQKQFGSFQEHLEAFQEHLVSFQKQFGSFHIRGWGFSKCW